MLKKYAVLSLSVAAAFCGFRAGAVNMVANDEIESKTVPAEYWLTKDTAGASLSVFEEDLTWNKCLKLSVDRNSRSKNGKERTDVTLLVGGTAKRPGYPVVGGRKYRFAFEARGTVAHAHVAFRSWTAAGRMSRGATTLGKFQVSSEWSSYKGTFTVPDDAATAALEIKLFADFEQWPGAVYPFPEGSCLMLDKFVLEPVSAGRAIWPARAAVLPDAPGAEVAFDDFLMLSSGRRPANVPSRLMIRDGGDAIRFELEMSGAKPQVADGDLWNLDSAELAVCGPDPKTDPYHWIVGPGGRTWAAETNPQDATCAMSARVTGETAWTATFALPWTSLGFAGRPPKGTMIRFTVARNTMSISNRFERTTVFGFNGGDLKDKSRFAVLYVGAPEGFAEGGDASAFYLNAAEVAEKARVAKLQREKVVIAQMPVTLDPTAPFLPDELLDPPAKLTLSAAVNERASLPVAIANMTESSEEYRVQLVRGYEEVEWSSFGKLTPGLKTADGKAIGQDRFTLSRAVRFRDSDAKDRGFRLDPLERLGAVSAVPVPSKEAGLLWVEFDCTGLEPGIYCGELVVTPLGSGTFRKTTRETVGGVERCMVVHDDSKRIPVELEVLPFAIDLDDMGFDGCVAPYDDGEIDFLNGLHAVECMVTPYGFKFTCDADGHIIEKTMAPPVRLALERLHKKLRKVGSCPRVQVGYSCYEIFRKFHAKRNNLEFRSPAYWRAYEEFIRYVADEMKAAGFTTDDYEAEIQDEPANRLDPKKPSYMPLDEVVEAYRRAHAAAPEMRLLVVEGEQLLFEKLFPYVDTWVFRFVHYEDPRIAGYAKQMRDAGKRVSMYACYTSPRQSGHRYYRQLVWKAAAWGSDFVTLYQLFDRSVGYEATLRMATYGGVAFWTDGGIVPSVRLKALEAGLNDIRWMRCLERLAAKSSDAALAAEAKDFIARSIEEVTRTKQHDSESTTRFRAKCAELIRRFR